MSVTVNLGRRQLLRGSVRHPSLPLRPPWAVAETLFTQRCSRCGRCAERCPQQIIKTASGGFPEIDFSRAQCTFCGECAVACPEGALKPPAPDTSARPWHLQLTIADRCLARNATVCRTCAEQCEPGALHFVLQRGGVALPVVEGQACSGCGACVGPCPVGAITLQVQETNP